MRQIKLLVIIALLLPLSLIAQNSLNQVDAQGRKQGPWMKKYPNGELMYEGTFSDDKPVGIWKRYFDNGNLKAILEYDINSDSVRAQLFEVNDQPVASGTYLNEKKAGNWTYFSGTAKIAEEHFKEGMKNGLSRKYYKTGELLEESTWKEDLLEGPYRAFFPSGKPYLECMYSKNKRNGLCISYYESGGMEVEASYENDLPVGTWTYYRENEGVKYRLHYIAGHLTNPETLRGVTTRELEELEKVRDRLDDPEKFLDDPSLYLMKKQQSPR